MVVVFLFNLMCAIVSCDPFYSPPTPKAIADSSGNSLLTDFISRTGRNLDANGSSDIMSLIRPPPIVDTESGKVEGYFMKVINGREVYAFEGIPYAEQPKIFQSPVPKRKWQGVRQAKKPGHFCVQMHGAKLNRVLGMRCKLPE
ncbi:Esterase FE4 [Orchesella cincta]|uniref:Esterase FE4 n=1 Tax=Orchesella cincta TaxID=48709 RepID=A0A1D2MTJ6_ORCCI|nr:Esterase FE4 [Orchesella cincta]